MERTHVADFYRGKGYVVHESFLVTGNSGNQQRVPLLAEGPLGNLAVFFGDAAGIDGPEIGAAKRVARDLGATAVVAAGNFSSDQRRAAAELGVVLLDSASMGALAAAPVPSAWPGQTPGAALERDLNAHPWPSSGRSGAGDTAVSTVTYDIDQVIGRFEAAKSTPTAPVAVPAAPKPVPATASPPARSSDGGLWQHARATPTPTAVATAPTVAPAPMTATSAPPATRRAPGAFAWLNLPKPPEPAPEIEYSENVPARAALAPPVPLTPEQLEAQRTAKLVREIQLRLLVRRGTWILGVAVVVYLFLLWWL